MRNLLLLAAIICLYACASTNAQPMSEEQVKEAEFLKLMDRVKQTNELSVAVLEKASEREQELVTQAAEKITVLNSTVNNLKTELNEVKAKLDSVNSDTITTKYNVLAVSHYKED